jgi:predicted RNA-binding Zn-ribbon protein involved in translation (DUF1610 family)
MMLFDRYTGRNISESDLPEHIDFGRFCLLDKETVTDVTYSNYPTNKVIHQELLLEKNKNLQDVLKDILIDVENANGNSFNVVPLIRQIKNKLKLNDFESLLYENLFHIEEIFRQPHYLLEREIEKVHVSRAKRIPTKSYQYLASHTEDWLYKSIVNFKPSRILHEELDLNFDIYENQFTISFFEKCLMYLNARIKEVQNIKIFLSDYEKLLKNRDDSHHGWWKKIERNLQLIGSVYNDDNYHSESDDGKILYKTEDVLNQIDRRLLLLRKTELFDIVNRKISSIFRDTNVFVNHKHYRYVKNLWIEFVKVKPEKSDREKLEDEQNIIRGLRAYATSLIGYCLKKRYLGYDILGIYNSFTATHQQFPDITMTNDKGVLMISIGQEKLKIIAIGNEPKISEPILQSLIKSNVYILYLSEETPLSNNRTICINPLDPDSCERIGSLIRKYILKDYIRNIRKEYKYPQLMRDYIDILSNDYLIFDKKKYTYTFFHVSQNEIIEDKMLEKINQNTDFEKIKSRTDRDKVIEKTKELICQINSNNEQLKKEYLYCPSCTEHLPFYKQEPLNYFKCPSCGYLLDSSNSNTIILKNTDEKYSELNDNDWGMDYLNFKIDEI